jgi:hypothetical protein
MLTAVSGAFSDVLLERLCEGPVDRAVQFERLSFWLLFERSLIQISAETLGFLCENEWLFLVPAGNTGLYFKFINCSFSPHPHSSCSTCLVIIRGFVVWVTVSLNKLWIINRRCALCVLFNDSGNGEGNIAWVIDELMLMIIDGTMLTGENRSTWRNSVPMPLCPSHIPHAQTWVEPQPTRLEAGSCCLRHGTSPWAVDDNQLL